MSSLAEARLSGEDRGRLGGERGMSEGSECPEYG